MTAPADNIVLHIKNLRKNMFAGGWLEIAELKLHAGEVVHLQGSNGSGKTTLLRLMAGLLLPDSCEQMRGNQQPPHTVYLHQKPYLFKTSVRKNIEYGLKQCGLPRSHAQDAMAWAGLEHLAKTHCTRLSGGEQSRVALARVRALSPKIYLLDEPTAHLDESGIDRVLSLIDSLRSEQASVVMSSHHDKIPATATWHLNKGRVVVD